MRKPVGKASSQKSFHFHLQNVAHRHSHMRRILTPDVVSPPYLSAVMSSWEKRFLQYRLSFLEPQTRLKKCEAPLGDLRKNYGTLFSRNFFFVIVQLFTFGQTSKFQVALYSSDLNKMPSKSLFYALVPLVNLLQDNLFASSNRHMLPHMLRQRNYISYHVGTLICPVKYEI